MRVDEAAGFLERTCRNCGGVHPIGDSADHATDAAPQDCACPCGGEDFAIAIGLALYPDSADIRWVYAGCLCTACGQTAVYADFMAEAGASEGYIADI